VHRKDRDHSILCVEEGVQRMIQTNEEKVREGFLPRNTEVRKARPFEGKDQGNALGSISDQKYSLAWLRENLAETKMEGDE